MIARPTVTAVIPVHNRADLLERLLATMKDQTITFAETLVVDNASTDSAREVARQAGCRVIDMGENAGFAKAVNRGCQAASGDWVAILNSDVELDCRWLEYLLQHGAEASFATGMTLSAAHSAAHREVIDGTYDLVSRSGCAWRAGHGDPAPLSSPAPKLVAIAPGTACIFRA